MLYLLYPISIKLLVEQPDVVLNGIGGTRIVPLEDRDLYLEANEITTNLMREYTDIISNNNMNLTPEQIDEFHLFISTHNEKDPTALIAPQDFEEFLKTQRIEDLEAIEKLRGFVNLENELDTISQERDNFAIGLILEQEGNGIVLRGSAHQEYVESGLTHACLNSTNF